MKSGTEDRRGGGLQPYRLLAWVEYFRDNVRMLLLESNKTVEQWPLMKCLYPTRHFKFFGIHTSPKASVYTKKIQMSRGIFRGIPLESDRQCSTCMRQSFNWWYWPEDSCQGYWRCFICRNESANFFGSTCSIFPNYSDVLKGYRRLPKIFYGPNWSDFQMVDLPAKSDFRRYSVHALPVLDLPNKSDEFSSPVLLV